MPTNSCYYVDFNNRAPHENITDPLLLIQPKCLLWGPSLSECNELFPEAAPYCDRTVRYFASGSITLSQVYFYIAKYWPKAYARNRVSAKESQTSLIATRDVCYNPKVDVTSRQNCTVGVDCDKRFVGVKSFRMTQYVHVYGNIVYKCRSTYFAMCEWSIRYYNDTTQTWENYSDTLKAQMNESQYNSRFKAFNLHDIFLENMTLAYGLYEVCVNCSMWEEIGTQTCRYFSNMIKLFIKIQIF